MSAWRVEFLPEAERDFKKLDAPVRRKIAARIDWLAEHFERLPTLPLHDDLKGFFKLRVGDLRAVYTFQTGTNLITVYKIEHRSKVYKKRR